MAGNRYYETRRQGNGGPPSPLVMLRGATQSVRLAGTGRYTPTEGADPKSVKPHVKDGTPLAYRRPGSLIGGMHGAQRATANLEGRGRADGPDHSETVSSIKNNRARVVRLHANSKCR